jgi:hypothetical protein
MTNLPQLTEQQAVAYLRGRGFRLIRIEGRADYMLSGERTGPERLIELAQRLAAADDGRRPKP